MIPREITEDLRAGMGLEECLIKHGTNLSILFKSNYPEHISHDRDRRYIEETAGAFYIKKQKDYKVTYFGRYSSLSDAQLVRDELINTGWVQNRVDEICERVGVMRLPSKNEYQFKSGII